MLGLISKDEASKVEGCCVTTGVVVTGGKEVVVVFGGREVVVLEGGVVVVNTTVDVVVVVVGMGVTALTP
jgi:hypothetical protein